MVDTFHFPAPEKGAPNSPSHLHVPASIHFSRRQIKVLKNKRGREKHWSILGEAASYFALDLMCVFQSQERFELPASGPFIAVVGDDLFRSLGPNGFEEQSLQQLIASATYVGIITCEPVYRVYAEAATVAAKERKNSVIIETQPTYGRDWRTFVSTVNPNACVRVALAEGESTDDYA